LSSNEPELTLWSALVVRGPLERVVLPRFREAHGVATAAVFDPTVVLMERLGRDDPPDVIVSTASSLASPVPPGIDRDSVVPLVRSAIGVGVATGATRPAIDTPDRLRRALLDARSVAYSRTGQSGIRFLEILERLGIAADVVPRATALAKGFTGEALLDGRADLAIQQISELRFVPGVDVVGAFPEECQVYTDFAVALSARMPESRRRRAGALLEFLTGEEAGAAYRDEGLIVTSSTRRSGDA